MTDLFVVVADSTPAATNALAGPMWRLVKQGSALSPAAHKHERDLGSDKAKFLRSLSKSIAARRKGMDESLILVAAPRLLGALKASLPQETLARLYCQVPRYLVDAPWLVLQQNVRTAAAKGRRNGV